MENSTLCPRIVHQYDQYDADDDSVGKLLPLFLFRVPMNPQKDWNAKLERAYISKVQSGKITVWGGWKMEAHYSCFKWDLSINFEQYFRQFLTSFDKPGQLWTSLDKFLKRLKIFT